MDTAGGRRLLGAVLAAFVLLTGVVTPAVGTSTPSPDPTATCTPGVDPETGEPVPCPTTTPSPTTSPEPTTSPSPTTSPEPTTSPSPTTSPEPTTSPSPTTSPPPTTGPDAVAEGLSPPTDAALDLTDPTVEQSPVEGQSSDELVSRLSSGVRIVAQPGADSAAEELAEAAAALVAAQEALDSAETQLEAAQTQLEQAEKARDAAQTVRDDAVREAAAARVAQQQAERDLTSQVAALEGQQLVLGALARQAYQTGGQLSSLSVVLESTTPQEFASNLRAVEAVIRSEDVVIAGLVAELADLAEAEARLEAAREDRERAEAIAERALSLAEQAEESARLVAQETERLVQAREDALAAAEQAQQADLEQYRRYVAAGQAIGYSLVAWAGQLDATGAVQGTGSFVRPGYGSLTSSFGARADPFTGYVKFHGGADYGIGDGGIYAADRGMVVLAGYNGSYGNVTVVSHGRFGSSSLATLYGHQSRILVAPGDTVEKGQLIGLVGSTGYSTGPHLHFEVRIDGTRVDPVPWLANAPYPDEYRAGG
jgi:murein DD-endopeptidase MepM/ murein hydrolase activator NlpD